MNFRTSLATVRGLGSAKSGTHHWLNQRLTAIALVPLSLWLLFSLPTLMDMNYEMAIMWVRSPVVAMFLLFFTVVLFYHLQLGLQVVLEDYVHCNVIKLSSLVMLKLFSFLMVLASIMAILKIYLE